MTTSALTMVTTSGPTMKASPTSLWRPAAWGWVSTRAQAIATHHRIVEVIQMDLLMKCS